MKKASTRLLEQGTQTPSPAPDLIPAETSTENLHCDWYIAGTSIPCCRHNSAVVNPASPCFRIAMICSSLCRVPFIVVLLAWVWKNSHSRWSSFRGLRQNNDHYRSRLPPRVSADSVC